MQHFLGAMIKQDLIIEVRTRGPEGPERGTLHHAAMANRRRAADFRVWGLGLGFRVKGLGFRV